MEQSGSSTWGVFMNMEARANQIFAAVSPKLTSYIFGVAQVYIWNFEILFITLQSLKFNIYGEFVLNQCPLRLHFPVFLIIIHFHNKVLVFMLWFFEMLKMGPVCLFDIYVTHA